MFREYNQVEGKYLFLNQMLSFGLSMMLILLTIKSFVTSEWIPRVLLEIGFCIVLLFLLFKKVKSALFISSGFLYVVIFMIPIYGGSNITSVISMTAVFLLVNYSFENTIYLILNRVVFASLAIIFHLNLDGLSSDIQSIYDLLGILSAIFMIIYLTFHHKKEVKLYQKKLQTSNSFFTEITDINPQLIFTKDINRKFTFVNRAMSLESNLDKENFYHKTDKEIGIQSIQMEDYKLDDERVLQHGATISRPIEVKNADGSYKWFETIKKPIINEKREITGLLAVTTNVTKLKEKEKELRNAKLKAEENDRLKSAFLANMSHEIRTPMNSIVGFSELLLDADLDKLEQKEFLQIINQNCQLLLHIVSDVLDISKLETGQAQVVKSMFSLSDQLEQLKQSFLPEAKAKNIDFQWQKPQNTDFQIYSDAMKVTQILTNLLSNAIKYTEEGGRVIFGYELQEESTILFFVKDSGIGISKELQEAIFERFHRTEKSIELGYKGTGLGLAISRGFAELLGGSIHVKSAPNEGSTFYFSLPYEKIEPPK